MKLHLLQVSNKTAIGSSESRFYTQIHSGICKRVHLILLLFGFSPVQLKENSPSDVRRRYVESEYCHATFQTRLARKLAKYVLHAFPDSCMHVVLKTSLQDRKHLCL